MKIEFENTSSIDAKLTIDGKDLRIECDGCAWRVSQLTVEELENTFGGIVAEKLLIVLSDVMQAECDVADEFLGTWDELPEQVLEAVDRRVS